MIEMFLGGEGQAGEIASLRGSHVAAGCQLNGSAESTRCERGFGGSKASLEKKDRLDEGGFGRSREMGVDWNEWLSAERHVRVEDVVYFN